MFFTSAFGINIVVSTAIGLAIGLYLDKFFHTGGHYLTVIFLILGIFAGFWQIIKEIIRLKRDNVPKYKKDNH